MLYVRRVALGLAVVFISGCTTELRINGKPAEIPFVVFEVSPATTNVAGSSRLSVRFRSIDGMATGSLEARLDDPSELFEIDRSECKTLNSDQTCSILVSFNSEDCTIGTVSDPRAKLVVQSENVGTATAELVGRCNSEASLITARR
jgi:hypothetical protein